MKICLAEPNSNCVKIQRRKWFLGGIDFDVAEGDLSLDFIRQFYDGSNNKLGRKYNIRGRIPLDSYIRSARTSDSNTPPIIPIFERHDIYDGIFIYFESDRYVCFGVISHFSSEQCTSSKATDHLNCRKISHREDLYSFSFTYERSEELGLEGYWSPPYSHWREIWPYRWRDN